MKCEVVAGFVKVVGKAIHALSKIGAELHIEDTRDGLEFKTVNFSRSGFASILFKRMFFHVYEDGLEDDDDDSARIKCKVNMKSCLSVFKSLNTIEKTVEKCSIEMESYNTKLIFRLSCRYGIKKTYELACYEGGALNAVYDKTTCSTVIASQYKLLNDAVSIFQPTQDEVTLSVTSDCFYVKSYIDDDTDTIKMIHSELRLEKVEFDSYQVSNETDVTFCLKELRALLVFGDITGSAILIQFSEKGRPIVFTVEDADLFEANFVLATLADDMSSSSASSAYEPQNETIPTGKPNTFGNRIRESIETDSTVYSPGRAIQNTLATRRWETPEIERAEREHSKSPTRTISSSPPSKRFRSIFLPKPKPSQETLEEVEVLASDSDEEFPTPSQIQLTPSQFAT